MSNTLGTKHRNGPKREWNDIQLTKVQPTIEEHQKSPLVKALNLQTLHKTFKVVWNCNREQLETFVGAKEKAAL